MKLPHRRKVLHLAAGVAVLPALSRIAVAASRPPVSTQRPVGGVLLLSQVAMLD
jgi:hypothetical protein